MPNCDSNVLFCFSGIASVGTCPPLAMNFKTCFFRQSHTPPGMAGFVFVKGKACFDTKCTPSDLSLTGMRLPGENALRGMVDPFSGISVDPPTFRVRQNAAFFGSRAEFVSFQVFLKETSQFFKGDRNEVVIEVHMVCPRNDHQLLVVSGQLFVSALTEIA